MSWLTGLKALLGLGNAASKTAKATTSAGKLVGTVTKSGKTIINAAKGSKIVVQLGEVSASASKVTGAAIQTSKLWIVAKWGALSAVIVGLGVGLKNVISGMFGSAHEGLSTVLESFGLSSEQADSGASIIFVLLFVMILVYAIPFFTNKNKEHKVTPVVKRTYQKVRTNASDDWNTIWYGDEGRYEKRTANKNRRPNNGSYSNNYNNQYRRGR